MALLLFFYNIIITICFALCGVAFFIIFIKEKHKTALYLSFIFTFFTFDNLVLFVYESLTEFKLYYETQIFAEPFILCFFEVIIIILYRLCLLSLREKVLSKKEILFWICYSIFVVATIILNLYIFEVQVSRLFDISLVVMFLIIGILDILKNGSYMCARGKPDIKLLYLAIMLMLEILVICELFMQTKGVFLLTEHRDLSTELISVFFIVLSAKYFFIYYYENLKQTKDEAQIIKTKDNILQEKLINTFSTKYKLTARETELLGLMLAGMTNAQISEHAFISINTAKSHTHNIYQKCEARNKLQLINKFNVFSAKNTDNI